MCLCSRCSNFYPCHDTAEGFSVSISMISEEPFTNVIKESPQAKKVIENKNTLTFSEEFARTVLDSLSAHISILDQDGTILETNLAWRKFAIQIQRITMARAKII